MTYRNILVEVDATVAGRSRAQTAADLANRFQSFLTGVLLKAETVAAHSLADGVTTPSRNVEHRYAEHCERLAKACSSTRSMFSRIVDEAGIPFQWVEVKGEDPTELVDCARRHDLVVLPQSIRPLLGRNTIPAAQIGIACGGPVLVLPSSCSPGPLGRSILVAWNGSRESARALRDAWPFLSQAEEIHVLQIGRNCPKRMDALLETSFREHACPTPNVIVECRDDVGAGALIKRHIGMTGADMAVLGLYGRSRLQELILGGVSRDLLQEVHVPLLMSH